MRIEHIALLVKDLEKSRAFYTHYFNGQSNEKYRNPKKAFESYFITFDEGPRLELMRRHDVDKSPNEAHLGWAHIAFSLGSKETVDLKTKTLIDDGYPCMSGPRTTGDGYYESVIEDPDGNLVELTV